VQGANPSIINSKSGKNSLHISAFAGHSACVKAVLEHLQTRHLQKEGKPRSVYSILSPIFHINHFCNMQVECNLSSVFTGGSWVVCRFIDALSTEGFAAIHYAAFKGNEAVMRMLLAAGANMMLRIGPLAHEATWIHARAGYTPLHIAASMGNASIIRMLLSHWKVC
jgi:ankyrin repeat protein